MRVVIGRGGRGREEGVAGCSHWLPVGVPTPVGV